MTDFEQMKNPEVAKQMSSAKLSEKITQFISLASKATANPYYNESEKNNLKSVGAILGLPQQLIDEVIQRTASNSTKLLKEISTVNGDLRELKALYVFTIALFQKAKQAETFNVSKEPNYSYKSNSNVVGAPNNQAQGEPVSIGTAVIPQYQTSIAGLQNHLNDLKVTTGGEGDYKYRHKDEESHGKIISDKSTLPLTPINKAFTFDR
jgi:hypothetical protein